MDRTEYLRVSQAAKIAGVSPATARRLADAGELQMILTAYGRAISKRSAMKYRARRQRELEQVRKLYRKLYGRNPSKRSAEVLRANRQRKAKATA